jgi:hypothetical protein
MRGKERAMHHIFNVILQFLQRGIAAIFRFVELIWDWSADQIAKLAAVPWHNWPILKMIMLVIIVVLVVWVLYRVAWRLWHATERILAAFAALLVALVQTLPRILLAGAVALGGLWVINHVDNSMLEIPRSLQVWNQPPSSGQATKPSDHTADHP